MLGCLLGRARALSSVSQSAYPDTVTPQQLQTIAAKKKGFQISTTLILLLLFGFSKCTNSYVRITTSSQRHRYCKSCSSELYEIELHWLDLARGCGNRTLDNTHCPDNSVVLLYIIWTLSMIFRKSFPFIKSLHG